MNGETILAQMAGSAVAQGTNQVFTNYNRRQDEASAKRLADYNANLAQAAQRNSAKNMVEGFKMAGLNPALAANSNFSPAIGGASSVSHQSPQMSAPDIAALQMSDAQSRLANAEAEKAEVEANRMRHEDAGSNSVLKSTAERILNDSAHPLSDNDKAYWELVKNAAEEGKFNLGDVQSQHNLENLIQKHAKTFDEVYSKLYSEQLMKAYLNHNVPETMANMKEGEFQQLALTLGKISAETLKLNSDVTLSVAKQREIEAHIQELLAQAKSIYHGDIAAMWQAGDYSALLSKFTYDTAQQVAGFVGLGKAAKVAGVGRKALTMQNSVLGKLSKEGYWDRQTRLSKEAVRAHDWARTMADHNRMLGRSEPFLKNQRKGSRKKSSEFPLPF